MAILEIYDEDDELFAFIPSIEPNEFAEFRKIDTITITECFFHIIFSKRYLS